MDSLEFKKVIADLDFDLLTDWEQDFLESVEGLLKREVMLTTTQIGKIHLICEKSGDRDVKSSLWPD